MKSNGPQSVGVLSSAKCTNEDNYLLQKFTRAVLGTNNVDHCARLCHASTVAAAMAAFGDGAMSNSIDDIAEADVLMVIGSNTTECHPLIGRKIRQAVKNRGAKLIVADPRTIELCELATVHMSHLPGTDVALLNGMMGQILAEGLENQDFIRKRCEDYDSFRSSLKRYDLTRVAEVTGVPAEKIRQGALLFGRAKRAMILYGMEHDPAYNGNGQCKGHREYPDAYGKHGPPWYGICARCGARTMSREPVTWGLCRSFIQAINVWMTPKFRRTLRQPGVRKLSLEPGLTITEMIQAAQEGKLKALYVMGENPMLSEPDLNHAWAAFARLEMLVVQDIFLTETAGLADVVLPAACFAEKDGTFTSTERRVQSLCKAVDPPGQARVDWEIIAELSRRMGYRMDYEDSADIMTEISPLTPIYGGMNQKRLTGSGLQWPCWDEKHPGTPVLHREKFTRRLSRVSCTT